MTMQDISGKERMSMFGIDVDGDGTDSIFDDMILMELMADDDEEDPEQDDDL